MDCCFWYVVHLVGLSPSLLLPPTVAAQITSCIMAACMFLVLATFSVTQSLPAFEFCLLSECFCLYSQDFYSWHHVMLLPM